MKDFTLRPLSSVQVPIPSGGGTAATNAPNVFFGTAHTSTSIEPPRSRRICEAWFRRYSTAQRVEPVFR